jgi:predicted DNA repair protein MutK
MQQVVALAAIGLGMTVFVYGLVAGIVKLDDLGLRLQRGEAAGARRAIGTALLRGTPWLMKTLSVVGTAAMFLVGGSIIAHGVPPLEHLLHGLPGLVRPLVDGVLGIAVGGVLAGVVHLFRRR